MKMATVFLIYVLSRPAIYWLRFFNIFAKPLMKDGYFKGVL